MVRTRFEAECVRQPLEIGSLKRCAVSFVVVNHTFPRCECAMRNEPCDQNVLQRIAAYDAWNHSENRKRKIAIFLYKKKNVKTRNRKK